MTTLDDVKNLSLEDLGKLIKKNYKALLKDKPKMKMMLKLYSNKLDEVKKPVNPKYDELYKLFSKGGETNEQNNKRLKE